MSGFPSEIRETYYHMYDGSLQEVGCFYMSGVMTAPSSSFSPVSPSADKPINRLRNNIVAARHKKAIQ